MRVSDGETWVDHRCLFHDDQFASASWQEATGVYFCRTENRVYAVPGVLDALFIGAHSREPFESPGQHDGKGVMSRASQGARVRTSPERPPAAEGQETTPVAVSAVPKAPRDKRLARKFVYRFPDGRLSHIKYRVGDGAGKTIWQEGPDGKTSLPAAIYPLYEPNVGPGLATLVVVEGEKCVDFIHDLGELGVEAITAGSSADLQKHAHLLAARCRDLAPATLVLWPDNDNPGMRAIETLSAALLELGCQHRVLEPIELGLGPKGDVIDFVLGGGQLADVLRKAKLPETNGSLDGLIGRLVVTHDGHVVFPTTRNLVKINHVNAAALWYHELHGMPADKQSKELAARLQVKSHLMPHTVRPRQHNTQTETWWRPRTRGPAFHVDAAGVTLADDPPETILLTPPDELDYPVDVDLDGSASDFAELAAAFHLSETETVMAEGWLCCALAGLQTPIMFMRAPAGTGKTTLARLLLSIVEPLCPELDLSKRQNQDMRELIWQLRSSQGLLLDNVSKLDSALEDQLAKLVTGYTTSLRPLYEDRVVTTRVHRALIITTTSYDVYKGDLAQRMIVASPTTERELRWLPDSVAQQRFRRYVPRIRGYIFHRLVDYYRQREERLNQPVAIRIADLGLMLACLGYDTSALARHESTLKASVIAQDDPWLDALVSLWKERDQDAFWIPTSELFQYLRDFGIKELPAEKSPRMARYIAEKNPIIRDHGFQIEKFQQGQVKGYGFSLYEPSFDDVLQTESSNTQTTE